MLNSQTIISANIPARQIKQIQIAPRNQEYTFPSGNSQQDSYFAVAFYDDFTVKDVTHQVTWTVVESPGGGSVTGAHFSLQDPGLLELTTDQLSTSNLELRATLNGFQDSVLARAVTD